MITLVRALILTLALSAGMAQAAEGIVAVKSPYDVSKTLDRLEAVLTEKGMTIMARVDHTANAAGVDKELAPTQVLIFGNPNVGTPLMQCQQSVAIDLPQKALAWEDNAGQVWLAYNDPYYLAERHSISGCDELLENISNALSNFAQAATAAEEN